MIFLSDKALEELSKEQQESILKCTSFSESKKLHAQYNIQECSPERFWREQQTIKHTHSCHFPISSQLKKFIHDVRMIDQGEDRPQIYFSLCSLSSLLLRYLASISIQLYVELTEARAMDFNTKMMQIIAKATDGQWKNITKDIIDFIQKNNKETIAVWKKEKSNQYALFELIKQFTTAPALFIDDSEKTSITEKNNKTKLVFLNQIREKHISSNFDLLTYLVDFRNLLIHAESIPPRAYEDMFISLCNVVCALEELWSYSLCVQVDHVLWNLSHIVPQKEEKTSFESNKQLLIVQGETVVLNLSPLLCISQEITPEENIEDVFFINIAILKDLTYLGFQKAEHKPGKALGTYELFKQYMARIPTPDIGKEDKYDFSDYALDKAKNFVGRHDVIEEIQQKLTDVSCSYIELRALAGMGKTAIFAHFHNNNEENQNNLCWIFHFCMNTDGRNTNTRTYRSLISMIGDKLNINGYKKRYLSWDIKELQERFQSLLHGSELAENMKKKNLDRLVIAIDALDEGFGGEEGIVEIIPPHIPEHVVFLYSYRVNQKIEHRRIQNVLQNLPSKKQYVLTTANPLKGLTQTDVQQYLTLINKSVVSNETFAQVWEAAAQDLNHEYADPFYLRFLLDGVQQKRIFLNRPETIPSSLHDAFEDKWLSLSKDFHFLGHRLLLTLAIMRDYGDDELFVELFNRNKSKPNEDDLTITDIAQTRLSIGKLLIYDGDRYTLFHDRFRFFLVGEQKDPIVEALGITE